MGEIDISMYGIVEAPGVWLYDKPIGNVVDELFMGWAVHVVSEKNGWLEVLTHYGYRGYLVRNAVKRITLCDLQKRDAGGQTVVICAMFADLMEEPAVKGRVLVTLTRGSFVTLLAEEAVNGYRKVMLPGGERGYLSCVSYKQRKDSDGYFYDGDPQTYFLRQECRSGVSERFLRERLVADAKSYLGVPYRWAGKSASGIDCSGLTFMCYLLNGILIYRDAKMHRGYPIHAISFDDIKPGDLLYFPGHIAMYLGNLRYIHATGNEKSRGCVINSFDAGDPDYRKDLADSLLSVGGLLCM